MKNELRKMLRRIKAFCAFSIQSIAALRRTIRPVRRYPHTIQLPVTYLCNFNCVMCGMQHMSGRKEFNAEELGTILSDRLFCKVKAVGVNGGEPFLKKDLIPCIEAMFKNLPKLHDLYFISNGFFTERILDSLREIKALSLKRGVCVHLSISVDGIGDMQDFHRGRRGAFDNAERTIRFILENQDKYVDDLNIICTITRYNIARINEMIAWSEDMGVEVSYNIATENVRIENEDRLNDFSLFSDQKSRMLAQEFFYNLYFSTGIKKYFGLYLYLKDGKRYADCPCMYNDWITLTPDTQIGFCATHSKNLGSCLTESAFNVVQANLPYLSEIKKKYCSTCSHYMYSLNISGVWELYQERMRNIF